MKLLLKTVKSEQTENGSWSAWPETRPPIFGNSDESMTALATLAMMPAAATGDDSAKAARDKGIRWLAETKTDDDPQSIAMRLVLWRRLGRPTEEWEPLVQRIKERQNADGGWSQSKDMASDAWATGQALYALAHAGIKPDEPVIARAQAFLIKTQRADGSWPMTSRPVKPGGDGSKEPDPDHRRRQRVGDPGAGAEPLIDRFEHATRPPNRWMIGVFSPLTAFSLGGLELAIAPCRACAQAVGRGAVHRRSGAAAAMAVRFSDAGLGSRRPDRHGGGSLPGLAVPRHRG